VNDITELFGGEVEELVEVDAAVGKLAELSSLLDLCRRGKYLSVVFCFEVCGVVWFGLVEFDSVYAPVELVPNPSSIALISSSSIFSVQMSQYRHRFYLR
jgi:hypothetical protein